MPFVPDPDVKFDVFVSYAHVDNLEGWVERFHKQLSIKLAQMSVKQEKMNEDEKKTFQQGQAGQGEFLTQQKHNKK